MKQILLYIILIVLITSCHQKSSNQVMYDMAGYGEEEMMITRQLPDASPTPIEQIEKTEVNKQKIIKDGRLGIRVTELESTKSRIDTLVKINGGYYAKESYNNSDYESSYSLKVRIPSNRFETFISQIESGEGEILYKEIDARDVTDQFIDLETRLDNKRNYLARYQELLKKAKTIKEILEIEERIRGLEEEIESTEGRLKYLGDLVAYSTLDLSIAKQKNFKYNPAKRDRFIERLKQSLSKGWFGFIGTLLFLIKIWPFWIFISLVLYFWKKHKQRKKNNK